jgi:hypothetical protein
MSESHFSTSNVSVSVSTNKSIVSSNSSVASWIPTKPSNSDVSEKISDQPNRSEKLPDCKNECKNQKNKRRQGLLKRCLYVFPLFLALMAASDYATDVLFLVEILTTNRLVSSSTYDSVTLYENHTFTQAGSDVAENYYCCSANSKLYGELDQTNGFHRSFQLSVDQFNSNDTLNRNLLQTCSLGSYFIIAEHQHTVIKAWDTRNTYMDCGTYLSDVCGGNNLRVIIKTFVWMPCTFKLIYLPSFVLCLLSLVFSSCLCCCGFPCAFSGLLSNPIMDFINTLCKIRRNKGCLKESKHGGLCKLCYIVLEDVPQIIAAALFMRLFGISARSMISITVSVMSVILGSIKACIPGKSYNPDVE